LIDLESAAKVSGQKFYYLKNAAALLEVALINWSLNHVVSKGFTPLSTPDLARTEVVQACGFQPRGEASQIYRVAESDLCLVGTAEIPLAGYYMNQILDEQSLPIRMVAFGHCFRREVGSAGQASKGLYRVHQFSKVEMFVLCRPDESDSIHEELLNIQMVGGSDFVCCWYVYEHNKLLLTRNCFLLLGFLIVSWICLPKTWEIQRIGNLISKLGCLEETALVK